MIGYKKRSDDIINVVLDIPSNTTLNYMESSFTILKALGLYLRAVNEKIQYFVGEEQMQREKFNNLIKDYTIIQGQVPANPCKLFLFTMRFSSEDALNNFIENELQSLNTIIESFTISKEVQRILEILNDLRDYSIEDFYDEILQNKGLVNQGKQYRFIKQVNNIQKNIKHENFNKNSENIPQYS